MRALLLLLVAGCATPHPQAERMILEARCRALNERSGWCLATWVRLARNRIEVEKLENDQDRKALLEVVERSERAVGLVCP